MDRNRGAVRSTPQPCGTRPSQLVLVGPLGASRGCSCVSCGRLGDCLWLSDHFVPARRPCLQFSKKSPETPAPKSSADAAAPSLLSLIPRTVRSVGEPGELRGPRWDVGGLWMLGCGKGLPESLL